tara:strand:- start:32089 stop:33081 length:993 start_codon:yes stop_codon:yes gene_type:complete
MKYKTNIIINNSKNIGSMVTFEYEREKPLSEKEQHTINMIIADEFGALEDIEAFCDIEHFFNHDTEIKLSGKDSIDFLDNLEERLSVFDVFIEEDPEVKILPNYVIEDNYKLDETDVNTIIYSEREEKGGLGFYNKETNTFINKKDYAKKCFDIDYQDWFEYENLNLIGEELDMVLPLIGDKNVTYINTKELKENIELILLEFNKDEIPFTNDVYKINLGKDSNFCFHTESFLVSIENSYNKEDFFIESLSSIYLEKGDKEYPINSYSEENLESELRISELLVTKDMASVVNDLIERNEMRQNIQENITNLKRKNVSLESKTTKRKKNGI